MGGVDDRSWGLSEEGIALGKEVIRQAGVRAIESVSLEDGIAKRAEVFGETTGVLPAALVNVGGRHVFYGAKDRRAPLRQGLNHGYHTDLAAAGGSEAFHKGEVPGAIKWLIVLWVVFVLTALWHGGRKDWWRRPQALPLKERPSLVA